VELVDRIAIGFTVIFVISVYIFAFWPRKRDEGINTPNEEE
jgi:hypothetical protein